MAVFLVVLVEQLAGHQELYGGRGAFEDAIAFLSCLVYLLSPDKTVLKSEKPERVEADLVKLVGQKSFLYRFFLQLQEARGTVERREAISSTGKPR